MAIIDKGRLSGAIYLDIGEFQTQYLNSGKHEMHDGHTLGCLIMVNSGDGRLFYGTQKKIISSGNIVVIPPMQAYQIKPTKRTHLSLVRLRPTARIGLDIVVCEAEDNPFEEDATRLMPYFADYPGVPFAVQRGVVLPDQAIECQGGGVFYFLMGDGGELWSGTTRLITQTQNVYVSTHTAKVVNTSSKENVEFLHFC
jgi:hypothetical protein